MFVEIVLFLRGIAASLCLPRITQGPTEAAVCDDTCASGHESLVCQESSAHSAVQSLGHGSLPDDNVGSESVQVVYKESLGISADVQLYYEKIASAAEERRRLSPTEATVEVKVSEYLKVEEELSHTWLCVDLVWNNRTQMGKIERFTRDAFSW